MSVQRSGWGGLGDPGEPAGTQAGITEERRSTRTNVVAAGSLACPACDAPVSPGGRLSPAAAIGCPVCGHEARVREFLSLRAPTRPAHVRVVVAFPAAAARRG